MAGGLVTPWLMGGGQGQGGGAPAPPPPIAANAMSLTTSLLGQVFFETNPIVDTPRIKKTVFSTETWNSAQVDNFDFITFEEGLIGCPIIMKWDAMSKSFWNTLTDFKESGEAITLDMTERAHTTGKIYTVVIKELKAVGRHHRIHEYLMSVELHLNIRAVT